MKITPKLAVSVIFSVTTITTIINNNYLFAQNMATVEDRSVSYDSESKSTSNKSASGFEEVETQFDTPVQNPNEVPNLVTLPDSNQNLSPINKFSATPSTSTNRTALPTEQSGDNTAINEEIRILEQEIEADISTGSKRKMMDLQSLSSDARLQRLENINEQQQNLKLDKKIRLLQLQLQALNGVLESQQHKLQQYQSQEKLRNENIERKLSELNTKLEQSLQSASIDSTRAIAKAKGFNNPSGLSGPSVSSDIDSAKTTGADLNLKKNSYTLKGDTEAEQQVLYNSAYEQIKARKYEQAIEKFKLYISKYPKGQFSEGANYWLGEIYMLQSKYDKALVAFDQVITKYPKGQKVPEAMYKKGLVFLYKKDLKQAKNMLTGVIKKYPNSEVASLATKQLKIINNITNAA